MLGGTFDPVHNGHLAIATLAVDFFKLSGVLFIPSGNPPHKPFPGASAPHRLAMLRRAVASEPSFEVREDEMHRTGPSYTFDTMQKLRRAFPRTPFYFIVGSDNLREIETWYRYRELLRLVVFCIAHRPGHSLSLPPSLAGGTFIRFPSPEWGISATALRTYLAKGYRCRHLVPESVREYIAVNNLYSLPPAAGGRIRHAGFGIA